MKVKFTQKDMVAIETAYFDNEGTTPRNTLHVPEEKAYRVLLELWHRMAERINKEEQK